MDCATNKTIGWFIGDRSDETFKRFYDKKLSLLKKAIFYTDDWDAYGKVLPSERHVVGKAYTIAIEQNNSNIRHYLARMTRRTKVVSKSEEMVDLSLRLCCYLNEMNGFSKYQDLFISI